MGAGITKRATDEGDSEEGNVGEGPCSFKDVHSKVRADKRPFNTFSRKQAILEFRSALYQRAASALPANGRVELISKKHGKRV